VVRGSAGQAVALFAKLTIERLIFEDFGVINKDVGAVWCWAPRILF